jgi:hypothetical protein
MANIFGDYETVADMSTIVANNTERHPNDLVTRWYAPLKGWG